MKKIRNIFLAFMLGIVSQSNAFDVCAGDFFEKYEKEFEQIKKDRDLEEQCKGFLKKQNDIQNATKIFDRIWLVLGVSVAASYSSLTDEYTQMLKVCSPNTQKLKARKAYFDMNVKNIIDYRISRCRLVCLLYGCE